jgi:hypothetical protein
MLCRKCSRCACERIEPFLLSNGEQAHAVRVDWAATAGCCQNGLSRATRAGTCRYSSASPGP